jgi:hypothetical protein
MISAEDKNMVVKELEGLIEQATKERSHYYVKHVCELAISTIDALNVQIQSEQARAGKLREALQFYTGCLVTANDNEFDDGDLAIKALAEYERGE